MSKLKEYYAPEKDIELNPVDYFNLYSTWDKAFSEKEIEFVDGKFLLNNKHVANEVNGCMIPTEQFKIIKGRQVYVFIAGKVYTKFMVLTILRFNNNFLAAQTNVQIKEISPDIPFIRVGVHYYKILQKPNKYGIENTYLKLWNKDELKIDFGPQILNRIPKFNDFILHPDNLHHERIIKGYYNLYAPFPHTPYNDHVKDENVPVSLQVLRHIFGEQFNQGVKYMKILYEMPWEKTFVLCLVSRAGNTGKTTFIKWLAYLFGSNFVNVDIESLEGIFNGAYKDKNIIAIDEAVSEKSKVVEKVKNLTTADTITANEKNINHYSLEFFGKIIFCSNKETEFIKVEEQEDRFWVRKVPPVPKEYKNVDIIQDLIKEIPMFLRWLLQQPAVVRETRFVMKPEEVRNESLIALKEESKSWLYKEIHEYMIEHFNNNLKLELEASPVDIKEEMFKYNSKVTAEYIKKVLRQQFKMEPEKNHRYNPFNKDMSKTGTPYKFLRQTFVDDLPPIDEEEEKQIECPY